jgi:hypothetical protein
MPVTERVQERAQRRRDVYPCEQGPGPGVADDVHVLDRVRPPRPCRTIVATFPAALDPLSVGRCTFSVTSPVRSACSASRITGSRPARDTSV